MLSKKSKDTKVLKEENQKIEDESYWTHRVKDDPRLDWRNGESNWIEGYEKSTKHPHRQMILDVLKLFKPIKSILEIGCNAGPNLMRIKKQYPKARLTGIDVNKDAIEHAQIFIPKATLAVTSAVKLPFKNDEFDIVLADAVLMYVNSKKINTVLDEMARVTKKAIILVEWYNPYSIRSTIQDFHWCHNYYELLKTRGFSISMTKIPDEIWPSKNWQQWGWLFVAHHQ